MKRILIPILIILLLLCGCGKKTEETPTLLTAPPTIPAAESQPQNRVVRLAVTELLADSPMVQALQRRFEQETPYRLELAINNNSNSISVGQVQKVDALLVQQGTASSQFVSAGYGTKEIPFCSESLLLLGPAEDPADVGSAETMEQALLRIEMTKSTFVSRYDDSDLYRMEKQLWTNAGVEIGNGRSWFKAARLGMSGTLQMAGEEKAYVLCEKEVYLSSDSELKILMQDVPGLVHGYCLVPLHGTEEGTINTEGNFALTEWLLSEDTQNFIAAYGTEDYGTPIFDMKTNLEG